MAWGGPGTHGIVRRHSTPRSLSAPKESCQVTGHPLLRVPAVDPNPGAEDLDGKDGRSQRHPPWEMGTWRAQRLSQETKLGWDSGGVTTRGAGTFSARPLQRGGWDAQRKAETSPRELTSKRWGTDGRR